MTCSLTAAVENEEYNVHAFLRGVAGKCQYHAEHSASGRFCDGMDDYGHLCLLKMCMKPLPPATPTTEVATKSVFKHRK